MYTEYGSFSPDKGVKCKLYEQTGCDTHYQSLDNVRYPGIPWYQNFSALQVAEFHIKGPLAFRCWLDLTNTQKNAPQ